MRMFYWKAIGNSRFARVPAVSMVTWQPEIVGQSQALGFTIELPSSKTKMLKGTAGTGPSAALQHLWWPWDIGLYGGYHILTNLIVCSEQPYLLNKWTAFFTKKKKSTETKKNSSFFGQLIPWIFFKATKRENLYWFMTHTEACFAICPINGYQCCLLWQTQSHR